MTLRTWILVAAAFFIGIGAHYALDGFFPASPTSLSAVRETGTYKLTAPLLWCAADRPSLKEDTRLQASVQSIVTQKASQGEASDVSVYYRNLSNGEWFGINENASYNPASLLKVPIMMAYLREGESDPSLLKKVLTYDGSFDGNANEVFRSQNDIQPGQYTIDSLLTAMIVNSDNNAMALLSNNIDPATLKNVYTDLGLQVPTDPSAASISPKEYSNFFRLLYNATYLTPEFSEKALELLAGPDFPQGIQATVPSSVAVANKFGERTVVTPQGAVLDRELHDCGIVYAPKGPYILCVMTRGKDFQQLVDVIQSISRFIYAAQ
jgi:beta-lactamase class A